MSNKIPNSPPHTPKPPPTNDSKELLVERDKIGTILTTRHSVAAQIAAIMEKQYNPALYYPGKECYVAFHVHNPATGKKQRVKHKLNHIKNKREREKYGAQLAASINRKLETGWNPFVEKTAKNSSRTIAEALEYYKENFLPQRPDSKRSYLSIIKIFYSWCIAKQLHHSLTCSFSHEQAVLFLSHSVANRSIGARTYNNYSVVMHTVFAKLIEHHFALSNPFASISKKKSRGKNRDTIPVAILSKITQYFQSQNPNFLLCMRLLFYCGIRPTEICRLQVSNLRTDLNIIYLHGHQTKNHREAVVTVPADIMQSIAKHVHNCPQHYYIFSHITKLTPGAALLNARSLSRIWSHMRKALSVPAQFKYYSLKDTGTTHLASTLTPLELKNQMRHTNLAITEIYIQRAQPVANRTIEDMKVMF